jgi:peroxiredoxin
LEGEELPRWLPALLICLIAAAAPPAEAQVLRASPEYEVKLTTGKRLLLSSYRGKVVVLMFVQTNCPHCLETCLLMEKLHKEYSPRGLQTLAVGFNDMALMLVPEFIQRTGATFPIGYDNREPVIAYLQPKVPALSLPVIVFIDRKGMIRGQYMGDDKFLAEPEKSIRGKIEELLKEPAGGPARAVR